MWANKIVGDVMLSELDNMPKGSMLWCRNAMEKLHLAIGSRVTELASDNCSDVKLSRAHRICNHALKSGSADGFVYLTQREQDEIMCIVKQLKFNP
ncbi:hypothetical protein J9978_02685 [Chromobacterium violaceum]|uniref:hypothetical protein n=1 Tax=Chromobacterium violaceum TaxID=536 RepID=UPI00111C62AB|nr:hypothetical protein [Chromobacterium violaceum]MBP4048404.1 hypothetical protein [Chromobacterium violaceum]